MTGSETIDMTEGATEARLFHALLRITDASRQHVRQVAGVEEVEELEELEDTNGGE